MRKRGWHLVREHSKGRLKRCLSPHLALLIAAVGLAAALPATPVTAADWPQWRGPLGTGVAPDADPPLTWSETENVRWKVRIPGRGHASPIVHGERIYVLTAVEEEPAEVAPPGSRGGITAAGTVHFDVVALDRSTGETVWKRTAREVVPHEGTHRTGTWASASAVTDGEVLIASFGSAGIYAFGLDGEPKWRRDLGDMRTRHGFGEGASPAIHGKTVVVNWDHEGESFIVALHRDTGEELWRTARDEPTSWSTPLIVEEDGRAQVIVNATNRIRSYDLATGDVIWQVGGMTVNTIPTPSYADGVVYAMSGFRGNNLLAIRLKRAIGDLEEGNAIAWSYDRDTSYVPSQLLYGDTLYFLKSNNGILSNLNAKNGKVHFGPERIEGLDGVYASPVGAADRVYLVDQDGTTVVLKRGRQLEILATNQLGEGFDASPAVAGNQLFLRGREHLYCLEEAGTAAAPPKIEEPAAKPVS